MKPKRAFALCFLVLVTFLISHSFLCPDSWGRPDLPVRNVDTGLEYGTIQEAINANETLDGHTINVAPGVYQEQIVLNKSLSLMGQDKFTTAIDGNSSQTVIQVTAGNVTVSGFTLQNTTAGYGAVQLYYSQNNTIRDNIMKDTYYGIYIYNSLNNTIIDNEAYNNTYSGAYLYFASGNAISGCTFSDNVNAGIFCYNSSNNLVRNNTILRQRYGIILTDSDTNVIDSDSISAVEQGIRISNSNKNLLQNNSASSCDNGIYIINSNNNMVSWNNLWLNKIDGIRLESSNSSTLWSNTIQNNTSVGVHFTLSNRNAVLNNSISANKDGIQLGNTDNCTINENEVAENENGIVLSQSIGNRLWDNSVTENQYALQFDRSKNNTLLNNNFINNTQQLASINSTSYFDNGVEGNYWDNYTGTDENQDAIGDTPYTLAENNVDNHPLMGPFSYYAIPFEGESYYVNFICNSKISEIRYDNNVKITSFNVTGPDGTAGFCRLPIPKILVSAPHVVLVDGTDVNARSLPISNSTHTFLYFTYTLSNHQVTIVSKTYYDLLKEYNTLLAKYLDLNSTYNTLLTDYNALDEKYTQLENNYNNLNLTYHQLTSDYETLQNSYNTLSASYTSLNSTYNSLRTSFEELNLKYSNAINEINNIRNLTYALIAGVIIIAALLLPTNIMFRRKINRQNKIIEAYNPLELARTLFMEDVKSRGAKIDKFQSKYGVKIQTRNTLEDVIKSLEKEKKK